jgi:hypothetical protein
MPLLSQTTYVKIGGLFDEQGGGAVTAAQVRSWAFSPATTANEIVAPDLGTTTIAVRPATVDYGTLELEVFVDANAKQYTAELWATWQGLQRNYAVAITCPDNVPADRYQQLSFEGIMRDTSREAVVDGALIQRLTIRLKTFVTSKYLSTLIFD